MDNWADMGFVIKGICRHKNCSPLFYASILRVSLCCKIVTQFLALHPTYIFSVVWLYIYIYMYMYKLLTIAFLHVYERIDIIRFQIHVLSFDKNTNWKTQFVTLKKTQLSEYIYVSYIHVHCINLKKTRCVQDLFNI